MQSELAQKRTYSKVRVSPPEITYHFMDLPLTRLHYLTCGDGPPLIMVPATVSEIKNWQALAEFMGQRFTVYFFELPGHGQSAPFPVRFSSALVAETVEAFIDKLGYTNFSLMGFSFGGILAMATLCRLRHRVEKVILISPAVTRRALSFSKTRLWLVRLIVGTMRRPHVRLAFMRLAKSQNVSELIAGFVTRFGNIEKTISIRDIFQKVSNSTADVLSYQISEMLDFEMKAQEEPFPQPCYFAMSVRDPLLKFETTLETVRQQFSHLHVERFDFPYHQPPRFPNFEEINADYGHLLNYIGQS